MRDSTLQGADPPSPGGFELAPGVVVPHGLVMFAYSRSAGPGGQNVNKRSTKAELRVRIDGLPVPPAARARLEWNARGYVTSLGELVIVSDAHRSQARNREECLTRLRDLIVRALVVPKTRRRTRPTRGSKERRLEEKRSRAAIKRDRRDGAE